MTSPMNYFYDDNQVRYTLVSTRGGQALNWLFIPGGPGFDSSYFLTLTPFLELPGNTWFIDFPGNGSHQVPGQSVDFEKWFSLLMPTVKRFENPVLVGSSFGGMFPLLFKDLEELLRGFVIISSAPSLWFEAAAECAKMRQLPDLSKEISHFIDHPTPETFQQALKVCMPYYFPPKTLEQGRKLFQEVPFAYEPAVWWLKKVMEISYKALWVPQKVPTLILGGELDAITPFSLFEQDERFNRPNIQKHFIKEAGHLMWFEKPEKVKEAFENLLKLLTK